MLPTTVTTVTADAAGNITLTEDHADLYPGQKWLRRDLANGDIQLIPAALFAQQH